MKSKIYQFKCIVFGVLFFSCSTSNIHREQTNASNQKRFIVNGKFVTNYVHCKGIAPTDEDLKKEKEKIPFPDYKFYVRKGPQNNLNNPIVDSILTDQNGEFKLELFLGEYTLIATQQKDRSIFNHYRDTTKYVLYEQCLDDWWKKGLFQFTLKNEEPDSIYIHIRGKCGWVPQIPCISFVNPPPPPP